MMRDVALFVTCLTDQYQPETGLAIFRILEHFGCRVHFPQAQTCCGLPQYEGGFHAEAAALARRMIEIFEPYPHIVTPSARCCAMVREHFPRLLEGQAAWQAGLERLVGRTYEFVEFLDKVLQVDFGLLKLPRRQAVTYHPGCRQRALGTGPDPMLHLLDEMRNLEFRPLEHAEQCCGFGGGLAADHPAISAPIADDKARRIAATAAPTAVCNETGCALHIAEAFHRQGNPTQVRHIAQIMAEALGLGAE